MSGCQATLSYKRNAHGGGCEHVREALEMKVSYEKVRKELERSEQRDQALTRELLATRATMQETQRDLHTFKTALDKTSGERKSLARELQEQKDYNSKLELQIARMEQSCQLIMDLDTSQNENKRMQSEMEKQDEYVQKIRDKDIAQQREIEALNRSLDAYVFYQGGHLEGGSAVSGEKLRDIYYELGKRQADIHALSLSLSEVNAQLLSLQESHKDLERLNGTTEVEIKHVKEYNDQLLQNSINIGKEMSSLEKEREELRECNAKLQEDVTTLMDKLKASMLGSADMEEKNDAYIHNLNITIENLQEANRKLNERLEALTLSLRHRESVLSLTEKRLEVETQHLQEDRKSLAESLQQGEAHASQIEMLRSNMTNALHANEILARESRENADAHRIAMETLNDRYMRADALNHSLTDQIRERDNQIEVMSNEREELVGAFKKSIATAKGLSSRLVQEQALSGNLRRQLQQTESSMQQIIKAKEQVSYAVLDALYKERSQHSQDSNKHNGQRDELNQSNMHNRSVSNEATPVSRPPLTHSFAHTKSPPIYNDDSTHMSSFANTTLQASTLHDFPNEKSDVTVHLVNELPDASDKASDWNDTTVEGNRNQLQESHIEDDSLDEDSFRNFSDSGVVFNKSNVSNDLERLKKEVAALEEKARKSSTDTKLNSTLDEHNDGSSSDKNAPPSQSMTSTNDELSVTNNVTAENVTDSESLTSTVSGKKNSNGSHSLFDLADIDPHLAFEHSQSPSPTKSYVPLHDSFSLY